jgi:hypothetical protein
MAIVFPASPTLNDTFIAGSITYKCVQVNPNKWIGLSSTPTNRLVEGSNTLAIDGSNNLAWTGGNVTFDAGGSERVRITSGFGGNLLVGMDTVYNVNATAHIRNGINIVAEDENGDVTEVSLAGEPVGRILFGDTRPGKYAGIDCIADGVCGTNDYPGRLVFRTTSDGSNNTAERMRITSSGQVQIANGNLKFSTAGTGIDFSANANATGMSSEVLDDYEEGTWTPTTVLTYNPSGRTITDDGVGAGVYVKIGKMVFLEFETGYTAISGSGGFNVGVAGLPFPAEGTVQYSNAGNARSGATGSLFQCEGIINSRISTLRRYDNGGPINGADNFDGFAVYRST